MLFIHKRRATTPNLSPGPSKYRRKKMSRVPARLAKRPSNSASAVSTGTKTIKIENTAKVGRPSCVMKGMRNRGAFHITTTIRSPVTRTAPTAKRIVPNILPYSRFSL